MPHLTLEYSANLEQFCEISSMCSVIRESALGTGVFPLGGIRVRARRCDHYSIADGRPECAFIDVEIRIGEGRSLKVRKNCTETIFAALVEHLGELFERIPLGVSIELREISADLSIKKNSIHKWIEQDKPAAGE